MFATLTGQFDHLKSFDDNITELCNRVLQREGSLEKDQKLNIYTPTHWQFKETGLDETTVWNITKRHDYTTPSSEDTTLCIVDICYVESKAHYGVVEELRMAKDDLRFYGSHTFDYDTGIPFAVEVTTDDSTAIPLKNFLSCW